MAVVQGQISLLPAFLARSRFFGLLLPPPSVEAMQPHTHSRGQQCNLSPKSGKISLLLLSAAYRWQEAQQTLSSLCLLHAGGQNNSNCFNGRLWLEGLDPTLWHCCYVCPIRRSLAQYFKQAGGQGGCRAQQLGVHQHLCWRQLCGWRKWCGWAEGWG